eukprot:Transcript_1888.p1 GENE.Transcript_1888~~Transcript_1888.p1  ORF type:complete len:482 (+),score=103.60 Transcript_1888:119-1564(+)
MTHDSDDDDCDELPEGEVQRRAAFDIGSGATKLMIADVDVESGTIGTVVHSAERTVKYALDWKKHGALSEDVQAEGIKALHALRTEVMAAGCTAYTAIATEVFRKAPNGAAFLSRVRAELGLEVELLTQEEEARLGFRTAVALGRRGAAATVAWDSGGASFQFSSEGAAASSAGAPLRAYVGALGSSVATAAMIEQVQGASLDTTPTPNPVAAEEAHRLVAHCRAQLPPPPPWLRGCALVTAIGGRNSIFRCAEQVTRHLASASASASSATESAAAAAAAAACAAAVPRAPPTRLGPAAVRAALDARCGLSDAALQEIGHDEEVEMVVPKLKRKARRPPTDPTTPAPGRADLVTAHLPERGVCLVAADGPGRSLRCRRAGVPRPPVDLAAGLRRPGRGPALVKQPCFLRPPGAQAVPAARGARRVRGSRARVRADRGLVCGAPRQQRAISCRGVIAAAVLVASPPPWSPSQLRSFRRDRIH